MGDATTLVLMGVAAFTAGCVDAVVGGGGLIQLPALLLGYPAATPAQLLATNKFGSIFGTATSSVTYWRRVRPDLRTALPLWRTLREMGMPLYFCQPPTGYDDTASSWISAGALVSRMNFAVALSKNSMPGVRVPLSEEQTLALKIGAPDFQRH